MAQAGSGDRMHHGEPDRSYGSSRLGSRAEPASSFISRAGHDAFSRRDERSYSSSGRRDDFETRGRYESGRRDYTRKRSASPGHETHDRPSDTRHERGEQRHDPLSRRREHNLADPGRPDTNRPGCRVFVASLNFDVRWFELRDFLREAGEIEYANVRLDAYGKSTGMGIVQFKTPEMAQRAIRDFNGVPLFGRPIVIREDRLEHLQAGSASEDRKPLREMQRVTDIEDRHEIDRRARRAHSDEQIVGRPSDPPPRFQHSRTHQDHQEANGQIAFKKDIAPCEQIYIKNLPFAASVQDLQELFSFSGNVTNAELVYDLDRRPRGAAIVEFDDVSGAESAIARFHRYLYGGRALTVEYNGRYRKFS